MQETERPIMGVNVDGQQIHVGENEVKQIGVTPSQYPGFYSVIIAYNDGTSEAYLVPPSKMVVLLGDERPVSPVVVAKPQLVVPER